MRPVQPPLTGTGGQVAGPQVGAYDPGDQADLVAGKAQALQHLFGHHRAVFLVAEEAQAAVYHGRLGRLGDVVKQGRQLHQAGGRQQVPGFFMQGQAGVQVPEEVIHALQHPHRRLAHLGEHDDQLLRLGLLAERATDIVEVDPATLRPAGVVQVPLGK